MKIRFASASFKMDDRLTRFKTPAEVEDVKTAIQSVADDLQPMADTIEFTYKHYPESHILFEQEPCIFGLDEDFSQPGQGGWEELPAQDGVQIRFPDQNGELRYVSVTQDRKGETPLEIVQSALQRCNPLLHIRIKPV